MSARESTGASEHFSRDDEEDDVNEDDCRKQLSFPGHGNGDSAGKRGVVISRTAGGDIGGDDESLSDRDEEEDHGGGGGGTPFCAGDGCSCTSTTLHTTSVEAVGEHLPDDEGDETGGGGRHSGVLVVLVNTSWSSSSKYLELRCEYNGD